MTEKEYRKSEGISKSALFRMTESPEKFKWALDNPEPPTPALVFGQFVHKLILEPETVDDEIVPVVEDVDKFFEKVARVYHAYMSKGESSTTQQPQAGNPETPNRSSQDFRSTGYSQDVSTNEQ